MQTQAEPVVEKKVWIKPEVLGRTALAGARQLKSLHAIEVTLNGVQLGPHS